MGIKTVPHPPYSPDLSPCDFWLFPKLRDCRYEIIEEMKEAVSKVIDTLTQEDFYGPSRCCWNGTTSALQAEEITSKGTRVSCVLSIKVPLRKKSGNLSNDPRISAPGTSSSFFFISLNNSLVLFAPEICPRNFLSSSVSGCSFFFYILSIDNYLSLFIECLGLLDLLDSFSDIRKSSFLCQYLFVTSSSCIVCLFFVQ